MDAPVREGEVLAGKYRVDRVLGVGGMGVVVAATHLQLEERVALKFLLPEARANPETVLRFEREARAAVKIKNQHVARMIDVGKLEDGSPYIVMEYLDGQDLSSLIASSGPLSLESAAEFTLHACEALAEAHGYGIVHRDLKPSNLFVVRGPDGLPKAKVLDFGISKMRSLGGSGPEMGSMTKTATVMGSPFYMSPEQMASAKDVDGRTDIWALGIVLYEMLAGRVPFQADTLPELCVKVLQQPPTPLLSLRPDLPPEIERIVGRCLQKDRAHRYANVAELAMDIAPFAPKRTRGAVERIALTLHTSGGTQGALKLSMPDSGPIVPANPTSASWESAGMPSRGMGTKIAIAVAGAVVVLGAIAAVLVLRSRSHIAPAAPVAGLVASSPAPSATPPPPAPSAVEPAVAETPAPSASAVPMAAQKPATTTKGRPAAPGPAKAKRPAAGKDLFGDNH
jgi:eukaryotic-like serine/threonine-protein kinase